MSVTLNELFESKAHIGHLSRYWHPKMSPFIFGKQNGMHQIDLDKVKLCLHRAMDFLREIGARKNSKVLFVGTKRVAQSIVREEAMRCGMPYVDQYWVGGNLTNFVVRSLSAKVLKDMQARRNQDGFASGMSKKAIRNFERKLAHLDKGVGGIKDIVGLPDALFVIDIGAERIAMSEARKLKIPIVAMVDTNYSPENVDYVIPGNDDASKSVRLYTRLAADAILEGRQSVGDVAPEEPAQPVVIKRVKKAVSDIGKPDTASTKGVQK